MDKPAPQNSPHHVVIIGGGFGGLYAARALAKAPVRVTLVDRRNFHLFQPLLYQVATGILGPGEITAPLRHILRKQKNATVLLGEVVELDPAEPPGHPGRRDPRIRHADRCGGDEEPLLRERFLGAGGAGAQEHRGQRLDPPEDLFCLRSGRARSGPGKAQGMAYVRRRRQRADGSGTDGHARRDREGHAQGRLPLLSSGGFGDPARRRGGAHPAVLSAGAVRQGEKILGRAGRQDPHRNKGDGHRRRGIDAPGAGGRGTRCVPDGSLGGRRERISPGGEACRKDGGAA